MTWPAPDPADRRWPWGASLWRGRFDLHRLATDEPRHLLILNWLDNYRFTWRPMDGNR
jgi:hypothetical protein